jgi:hypothetical protein
VPPLQELSHFWMADSTAATLAWIGWALRFDLPTIRPTTASSSRELFAFLQVFTDDAVRWKYLVTMGPATRPARVFAGVGPSNFAACAGGRSMATEPPLPQVGTQAGRISLNQRRLYRSERHAHVSQCTICGADRLPVADAARAACKLIPIDPATIAYTAAELSAHEREHYQIAAAQAIAIVLGCRVRGLAANTVYMDALGAAFSTWYRHHVEPHGVARSIRQLTEVHAEMVRRELQLAGLDLGTICTGPTPNGTVKTDLYTITRTTTMGAGGRRRPGRQIVSLAADAVTRFEAVLGGYWLKLVSAPAAEDDDEDNDVEGGSPSRYKILAEQQYEIVESGTLARSVMSFLERARVVLDVGAFREDLLIAKTRQAKLIQQLRKRGVPIEAPRTKGEVTARRIAVYAAAKKQTQRSAVKWRRDTFALLEEYDRVSAHVRTFEPRDVQIAADATSIEVGTEIDRTTNRRFQPLSALWPSAVSDKSRAPWGYSLRRHWFRGLTGEPLVEVDVSSSQTQILCFFLAEAQLDGVNKKFLAKLAWDLSRQRRSGFKFHPPLVPTDRYTGPDDPRLLALVKEAWMRTLYGSQPARLAMEQSDRPAELGQGWDHQNLTQFLRAVPGWKTVSTFLRACQKLGTLRGIRYGGITVHDPFDEVAARWHPAATKPKRLVARSRGSRTFSFEIDIPRYAPVNGEFRVDGRRMKNCIAPRLIHMLDAALNGHVAGYVESVAPEDSTITFVATHDAWTVGKGDPSDFRTDEEFLETMLDNAARDWFRSLEPVYDDLIRYLGNDAEFGPFAHEIKAKWRRQLAECEANDVWPEFVLG